MATTQLSDIYNPLVFAAKAQEAQLELNKFITSGVMVMDADISASAGNMSNVGELPFFKPLTIDEPNYSTDDPASNSVAGKVTDSKM
ncbi:MAG: hypothetical protein GY881_06845, partial [Gammaproteobacteria bacterium]|nr:hypothetical protein [Gammaproteobacteria bacterium]